MKKTVTVANVSGSPETEIAADAIQADFTSAATCPTCGHSTEHTHEWEAAGQVEMPYTLHSPVSRTHDHHGTRVYIIQSCKCGSTRHKLVAEK